MFGNHKFSYIFMWIDVIIFVRRVDKSSNNFLLEIKRLVLFSLCLDLLYFVYYIIHILLLVSLWYNILIVFKF